MPMHALTVAVAVLYAMSTSLIVFAFVRRRLETRRDERRARLREQLRGPFEACILEARPLARLHGERTDAVLDLALRYSTAVRGVEADRILECLEAQGITGRLLRQMTSRSEWKRAEAAELLGRLREPSAVEPLLAALDDPSEDVRTVAARGLAAIGDPSAVPALAGALSDPSRWTLSLVAENLMAMGPAVVQPLMELLEDGDHNVRVAAVQILGEIRDSGALPVLIDILAHDESLNLRAQAAAAIGKLGGPQAQRALLEALGDPAWQVRGQAAKALGRIGHPGAAHTLALAMPDSSWWVRVNCAEALARLGADGRHQLENLLDHPDRYVRDQALSVLEIYGLREATA
jgi:hypothetical protein